MINLPNESIHYWPIKWYQSRHTLIRFYSLLCDPLTSVVMETLDCFDLHDLVLNDDDDIQDAYCKLYNFCMRSLKSSTKLKAKFEKVKT